MTLCSTSYKSKELDGKRYGEITEFKLGEHYTVIRSVVTYDDGTVWKNISVNVSYEDRHENYIPEIYYSDGTFGLPEGFTIQTTAYGAKSADEIKKVIAGYQEALEAVEILTKNFCKK